MLLLLIQLIYVLTAPAHNSASVGSEYGPLAIDQEDDKAYRTEMDGVWGLPSQGAIRGVWAPCIFFLRHSLRR